MKLTSPVFASLGMIPPKYTCDGENVNPPLVIREVPPQAKSLVLIIDDPDAAMGTWVHWLVWNIKPTVTMIKENSLPEDCVQGLNGFGERKYGGPCPPSGTHRYFFKIYALDTEIYFESSVIKQNLLKEMQGHVIDHAELIGRYHR
ncbi:YbhB/YbcL family Raf kinase inhibitor-like protein [Patescibacteria group bacterium]